MLVVIGVATYALIEMQAGRPKAAHPYAGQPLPPLHVVSGWLNTSRPVTAADLQGKVLTYHTGPEKPVVRHFLTINRPGAA